MSSQGTFFPTSDEKRAATTLAPETLNPAQMKRLESWAEDTVPWIRRGALGALTGIEWYVQETLEYWQATGKRRSNWVATIQVRIRDQELRRLRKLADMGSETAKLALRSPGEWARSFDRLGRLKPQKLDVEEVLSRPTGGTLIHLRKG